MLKDILKGMAIFLFYTCIFLVRFLVRVFKDILKESRVRSR